MAWGGDVAWGEGEVAGISGPKVHSVWVTPKIFGVAFKILQRSGVRLEFLAYSGMLIYICWCWCIKAEPHLHRVSWRDNYGFLTSLYPPFYPILNTVSWPITGILYDLSESKVSQ